MFFKKKNKATSWVEHHAKKIDKFVTTLIIWWAVASMVGLSKTKKWKEMKENISEEWVNIAKKWYSIFGKTLVNTINFFTKK